MNHGRRLSLRLGLAAGAIVFVGLMAVGLFFRSSPRAPKVCITQIASHPSLDEVRHGIIEGLAAKGYRDGHDIIVVFRNANGDPSLALPIAQDFVRQGAAVIVPITTPSALGAAKSTDRIPIIFAGVTDPKGVGLVADLDHPNSNITGTSDRWPYEKQIDFFLELLPTLKRLGMLYTAGDDVSAIAVREVVPYAASKGIHVIAQPVSSSSDVYPSAVSMLRNVDAIYTGTDNLIAENLESILKAAREAGKPVLAGDTQSVERGALGTWSISMRDLGEITGQMVAEVLHGKTPREMPVRVISQGAPVVNSRQAERFGIPPERLEPLKPRLVDGPGGK